MPGRGFEERAIAARVRSWVGSVAARERVPAAHGMTSFEPRRLAQQGLDALSVRFLVTDGSGEGVARLSSFGVVLSDRGERVGPAPPASFAGDVPGLVPGLVASVFGLGALIVAWRSFGRGISTTR
jgi:hypothetical protein